MPHKDHHACSPGFSLPELLAVLAITVTLATIAMPAYQAHLARTHRAQARSQLLLAAQFMERFYAANDRYDQDRTGRPVWQALPEALRQSPAAGGALYRLELPPETLQPMRFVLHMVPAPSGAMARDACGSLTLSSSGARGVVIGGTPGSAAQRETCWR